MSENKKYYYMKLKDNFFTSERMVVLETMPDGILYSNLLLKMYLMSLKHNGILLLHENLPHTPQTIATFTRHQIGTVERALQIFLKLGFVELLTDGAYYMPDIQLLVGRSSTEAERKRRERLRLQAQKLLSNSKADICPPENRDKEIREQKCARTNIIDLQIAALNRRLADKQLRCELTQAAKQFINDAAYDPQFGARPLRRYVQHTVETLLAKKILEGSVQPGSTITVDTENGELVLR